MSYCTKCGNELEYGAKYCPVCGAPTDQAEIRTPPFCTACGSKLDDNLNFCPICGKGVGADDNSDVCLNEHKNLGVAVLLSLFIPGTGHMYDGKIGLGFGMMIINVLSIIVCLTLSVILNSPLILFGILVAYIYTAYDAYNLASELNQKARTTGKRSY